MNLCMLHCSFLSVLPTGIKLPSGDGNDHTNQSYPAISLCLSQARAAIAIGICRGLSCDQRVRVRSR
jgi:hypothetical protein